MTCWWTAVAVLCFIANLAYSHTQIRKATDPLCVAARCSDNELCVVKDGEPQCISKIKLIKLAKKHGIHHPLKHHVRIHKHHKHDDDAARDDHHRHNHLCSHDELVSMGGRLLQWFSDMHRVHFGREKTLPGS
ncbi:hypothetical protein KIN20_008587 [Parelaphostrongylus tenuis]|uniref:Uncharacterized protein n=1 Tax=Parelaphostrongylus tenuis TaxID=148309 RepID=A0AAD5QIZ8_PARTN|nr:hypothetical protein KIN20_008587 [Parelaphostrongylus tenuis]